MFLPDNTVDSFNQALIEKADMIEMDVRKTADGKIVLFHDWYVKPYRINPLNFSVTRPVSHISFKELSDFCEVEGFRLVSLEEVLQRFGGQIEMNIELKAGGYEYEVLNVVKKYDLTEHVVFSSFFPWVIKKLKDIDNDIKAGWIVGQEQVVYLNRLARLWIEPVFKITGADSIHLQYEIITPGVLQRFQSHNVPVYVWTVNDTNIMRRLIGLSVDGIITNMPGQLYSLLNGEPLPEEIIILSDSELTATGEKL